MLDNMSLYADMSGLCKKGWNGFGWSYYSATWKYFKGIFLVIFHYWFSWVSDLKPLFGLLQYQMCSISEFFDLNRIWVCQFCLSSTAGTICIVFIVDCITGTAQEKISKGWYFGSLYFKKRAKGRKSAIHPWGILSFGFFLHYRSRSLVIFIHSQYTFG